MTFWFLVAVVLAIGWMRERANGKERAANEYQRGKYEARTGLIQKLDNLLRGDAVDIAAVRQAVGLEPVSEPTTNQPEGAQAGEAANAFTAQVEGGMALPVAEAYKPPTAEDIAAEKEQRTVANLNKLLYVGSFMIVAAAALFVNLTMPAMVKLAALALVMLAFYVAGLVLYEKSVKLRPAAIAFTGTGLAILPFVGFALTYLGGWSKEAAWFATSLVGLVAYGVAAVRLRSQLVSYITMAFVVSLALSAVSTLGLGAMWYFIVVIGVSTVINSIVYLLPNKVPAIFGRPLKDTGQVAAPITLIASLFLHQQMDLYMYEVLFGLTTLHYVVIWLQTRRLVYELTVRALAHLTALVFFYDMGQQIGGEAGAITFASLWVAVAVLQVLYSCFRVDRNDEGALARENASVALVFVLLLAILPSWLMTANPAQWFTVQFAVMGLIYGLVAVRFRQVGWAYVTLAATFLVPGLFAREVMEPALPLWVLALGFAVMGAITLAVLDTLKAKGVPAPVQTLFKVAAVVYALCVANAGLQSGDAVTIGWTMAIAAALMVLYSYVARAVVAEVVGAVFAVVSIAAWVSNVVDPAAWQWLASIVLAAVLMAVGAAVHQVRGERLRRDALAVVGATIFAGLAFTAATGNIAVLRTATILLIIAGIALLGLRIAMAARNSTMGVVALGGYVAYPVLAFFTALALGQGWLVLTTMVLALLAWVASYVEYRPFVLALGNVVFVIGMFMLWNWLRFNEQWQTYGVAWLTAGAFYAMYWFNWDRGDLRRQAVSFWSVITMLGLASLIGIFMVEPRWAIASAGSLIAGAAIVGLRGYLERNKAYMEAAVYAATLGLQRIVEVLFPAANSVLYGHWWALTVGLVAMWRHDVKWRVGVAMAFITLPTGLLALTGNTNYQLFFLIEHIILAVAGALTRKQWVMWWSIAATIVAILYFLRTYTFMALLFIGILLIVFVVWRLTKSGNHTPEK